MASTSGRMVTPDDLGAWLLRCDPDLWDLPRFRADGHTYLARWSVHPTYRVDLMAAGQNVVLWLTGNAARSGKSALAPGVWGVGHLTGPPGPDTPDPLGQQSYWTTEPESGTRKRERLPELFVPLHLPFLPAPISRSRVQDTAGLTELEVLRSPQGSNPSYLTRAEWRTLQEQLPLLAEDDLPFERDDAVEAAAVKAVTVALDADDWTVLSVEKQNLGYDLTARRGGQFRFVEVKGRGPWSLTVRLTRNELRAARDEARWELAVVPDALGAAPVFWFDRHTALAVAEPTGYQAVLDARTARSA